MSSVSLPPVSDSDSDSDEPRPEADKQSEQLRTSAVPRRYSIFIPTEVARNSTEEQVEPSTIIEVVVEPGDTSGQSGGKKRRHRNFQHGGALPEGTKIYRVNQLSSEVQQILLSFKPANQILTDDFLTKLINGIEPLKPDEASEEYKKIKDDLIPNIDDTDYFVKIGQKAVWKTSIMKLMNFLDTSNVRTTTNGKTYHKMYNQLWRFMDYAEGSIAVLRSIFSDKKIEGDTSNLVSSLIDAVNAQSQRRIDLGWKDRTTNVMFDKLFKEFSKCLDDNDNLKNEVSKFLQQQTSSKQNQQYRFKLNWYLLIAFHMYYSDSVKYRNPVPSDKKKQTLIDICELVEHVYNAFLGWMDALEPESLRNIFKPNTSQGETYQRKVDKLISTIKTDPTVTPLLIAIQRYLCQKGPTEPGIPVKPSTKPTSLNPRKLPGNKTDKLAPGGDDTLTPSTDEFSWQRKTLQNTSPISPPSPPPPPPRGKPKTQEEILLDLSKTGPNVEPGFLKEATDAAFNRERGPVLPEVDVDESSENDDVSEGSRSGTGRQAWGETPSTKNRPTKPSESQSLGFTPSPPSQNPPNPEQLFIRREASPEVPKLNLNLDRSKELLKRLPEDARRPSTARPSIAQSKVPSSGSLSARIPVAVERPAVIGTSENNPFKRSIRPGSNLPSAPESSQSFQGPSESPSQSPSPPSAPKNSTNGPGLGPRALLMTRRNTGGLSGGSKKQTRRLQKHLAPKLSDKPKKTRRHHNKNSKNHGKYTRKTNTKT